jgi:hypothetical protein
MKYQEWQKKSPHFVAMTGYREEKFNELLPYFKETHDEYLSGVRVEHAIRNIKRYRTVKDECRLRKNLFVERGFRPVSKHN